MRFVEFIFSDFWRFLGFFFIIVIFVEFLKRMIIHKEIMKWGHPPSSDTKNKDKKEKTLNFNNKTDNYNNDFSS